MRPEIKHHATRLLDASGVLALPRRLLPRWPRILMYHQFCGAGGGRDDDTPADVFRQQLQHITQYYQPIHLQTLAKALANGEAIPPRSVALTVDDGHASFLRYAVPLLEEFQVPATLFVVSDLPNGGGWLWTDRFMYVCDRAHTELFPGPEARTAALVALKRIPPGEREYRLVELTRQAGVVLPAQPPPPYDLLSWEELQRLSASPLIEIGSHTRTHATLCSIDDDQSWDEICGSRRELERRLDAPITAFCYPNGSFADYRREQVAMVAKAGYLCATAAHFGCVREQSNRFALPRIACHAGDITRFRKTVDGLELLRRRLRGEPCY
ncbi:MAG: polysaccharide deacetylase family protein [Deltaproteobacteria bacterium]|nr:polysaccharide deacetylase family protein [Deltaproteobacteria bacterium]